MGAQFRFALLIWSTSSSHDQKSVIYQSSGGITQSQLDTKQNTLTAGTNITIDANNNISSSGVTQSQLDTKQPTLNDNVDITTGTISSGNITGRVGSTITAPTITAPTITASTSLLYGTTNVETKITEIEDTLETTPRLNNANVFTANQEIEGSLTATFVAVTNTTPINSTHLTSRFYVDSLVQTRVREVEDEIVILTASQTAQTAQSSSQSQSIIAFEQLTATQTSDIFALEVGKQDNLTAGTGIDITNNVISSTSSFVGFRAVTIQNSDINVAINAVIPFNSVSVNTFTYDTENSFDTTASSYTIPSGYSGYWMFNMNLFIAEYSESFKRVHLRITRGASTFEPLQVGNYNTQINFLNGTIPVLEGDIIRMFVSSGGAIRIYTAQNNCWFEGRYLG